MCHAEFAEGQSTPKVSREEVAVPLASGESLPGMLASPEGGRGPAVLIIPDIYGRSPFYENLAARLAEAGFQSLVVDIFVRQGPLAERKLELASARRRLLDENKTVVELGAGGRWLRARPEPTGSRVGTIGFCMGGTHVLILASLHKNLASVCYYGYPVALSAIPAGSYPIPVDLVDQARGPILGFWGDQDSGVGMENVEKYAAELHQRDVDFEYKIYPGVGHGFLGASNFDPDHAAYDAAINSWERTLAFYRENLP